MFGFLIFVHTLVCILLATIILMQAGRGGGLTANFAAAESMFGAKTNVVLVKGTTILATIFIVTCLSLAFLSAKSNKSLIAEKAASTEAKVDQATQAANPSAAAAKTETSVASNMPLTKEPTASAVPANAKPADNANMEKTETQPTNPSEPAKTQ